MVTTTGTTATPTPSATSVTQAAAQSLLTSLSAGSGVDTASLVTNLVQAQFATKTAQLTAKSDTLTAQISGVSSLKSAITGFATALESLVKGGTLATQPTSSDTSVLTATALSGAKLSGLSSSVVVGQLAVAQATRTTDPVAGRTTSVGTGTMTLAIGTATADGLTVKSSVQIDVGNGSLDSIAAAINAQKSKTGVTASVVTDAGGGAYLSMKGATGAARAFTLTANADATGDLATLNAGPGTSGNTSVTASSQDAKLTVDGIAVTRSSNTISDLIDGVKLELKGVPAVEGTPVTLGGTTPSVALSQAVSDVVDTYNQVLAIITKETDPETGDLRADPAAKSLLKSLQGLTLTKLLPSGTPSTLAEIGVATNRDGTLRVDSTVLTKAMATSPDAIEAMFAPSATTGVKSGLSAVLNTLSANATSKTLGLGASETRYNKAEDDIATQQDRISIQAEAMTKRLTQQFSSMNSRVSAYKSTQTFLTNQIAAWNKSDS